MSEEISGHDSINGQVTVEVVGLFVEGEGALGHVNMGPLVVSECINLLQLIVTGEVDDLFDFEPDAVIVDQLVNLLLVIHKEEGLGDHFVIDVVLDVLSVRLECDKPAPR